MNRHAVQHDALPEQRLNEALAPGGEVNSSARDATYESALVRRCIAGEVRAWEELYSTCHGPLLASIRAMLADGALDRSLIDEIAAGVWYALVENDGQLLERFDSSRGARLTTFMRAIAKDRIARHLRSERRRRHREAASLQGRPGYSPADQSTDLPEFLSTLTPRERRFADAYLLAEGDDASGASQGSPGKVSKVSIWQLSRRIRRKLLAYLG